MKRVPEAYDGKNHPAQNYFNINCNDNWNSINHFPNIRRIADKHEQFLCRYVRKYQP